MTAGGAVKQEDREERKMKQQLSVISQGDAKPEDYVESLADFPLSRSVPLSLSPSLSNPTLRSVTVAVSVLNPLLRN